MVGGHVDSDVDVGGRDERMGGLLGYLKVKLRVVVWIFLVCMLAWRVDRAQVQSGAVLCS